MTTPATTPADGELHDDFRGDDAHLVSCIKALISLSDEGALVPHGIGGHARALLSAAAVRLSLATPSPGKADAEDAEPSYERKFQSDMAELVMRHIDRMNDVCSEDTAVAIINSFTKQFDPLFEAYMDEKFPGRPKYSTAIQHASDCAVHNEPAYPAGPCDCGAGQQERDKQ